MSLPATLPLICHSLTAPLPSPALFPSSAPLSPGKTPAAVIPPLTPESPTHASRGRFRAVNGSIATSMRRFADYGELKKAALMLTAFQLDREEIKLLKVSILSTTHTGERRDVNLYRKRSCETSAHKVDDTMATWSPFLRTEGYSGYRLLSQLAFWCVQVRRSRPSRVRRLASITVLLLATVYFHVVFGVVASFLVEDGDMLVRDRDCHWQDLLLACACRCLSIERKSAQG